ncbi:pre-mRNA-splicing factor ATP-dependent RNA helicase prp22 [Nannizzia gypsea CBS 118893]|uniref:RNA helicase n=1 Tax=Arthroderma gypseum (strain ATCC MYA-4604 / CBS 118893) TaxID=535722 RepID=E5R2E3_ARTGP|nr:pre-mRNA-splicing factor ATP-dependent RNA helicase prp22 [Nannizzia gypsea CBS 118893]EFQ97819.1 pre-mRNA-splicing factor ATP-dependent RNA helicase prp22 [Nannizzia gypsea CBS 118893]
MAPNKKKKKTASNPARGFATVSVPSKVKPSTPSEPVEPEETAPSSETLAKKLPVRDAKDDTAAIQPTSHKPELHELTPDELERHLEEAELQTIVDKHGIKCKGDAARFSTKTVAERRLLRPQAPQLENVTDWLSPDLLNKILEKEKAEARKQPMVSSKSAEYHGQLSVSMEESICVNMWTLRLTLLELGFQGIDIDETLKILLLHGPLEIVSGKDPVQALDLAFCYLALYLEKDKLAPYDEHKPIETVGKVTTVGDDSINILLERIASGTASPAAQMRSNTPSKSTETTSTLLSRPLSPESEGVSGLHEPEMLIPEFLALRSRLYELDPSMFNKTKSKKGAKTSSKQTQDANPDPAIASIKRKIARIEQDILFDSHEAEERWAGTLEELRLSTVETLRSTFSIPKSTSDAPRTEPYEVEIQDTKPEDKPEEDEGLFGEMFDLGLNDTRSQLQLGSQNTSTRTRDFGKPVGINPKKVLDDFCRPRDTNYTLIYHNLSDCPFLHRQAVQIQWSKDQDIIFEAPLKDISYRIAPRSLTVYMAGISAASATQAESYISTVALFILSSHAWKESKASIKLSGVWKNVWDEISLEKKEHDDQADRQDVKTIKGYIQEYEAHLEEDVVLVHNFRQRYGTGDVTPSTEGTPKKYNPDSFSPDLQALWARRSSSSNFQRMAASRAGLPIWSFRDQVLDALSSHQTIIICGETGSGKSTQIPSFILENELAAGKECKVYVTEPRRISAISLARRVSEELGENKNDIGTNRSLVGYAIRLESKFTASTRLIFATTGIVIRMLERPQDFDNVTHLVLDEVHERTIDGDFLLIVLRRLLSTRHDLKLVLMSATVDAKRFSDYLNGAPILNIPGRMYPVEIKYLEDVIELTQYRPDNDGSYTDGTDDTSEDEKISASEDITTLKSTLTHYSRLTQSTVLSYDEYRLNYKLITDLLSRIATRPELVEYSKAILIFMPGLAEIRRLHDEILSIPMFQSGWVVYSLHSSIASEDQEKAFIVPPHGIRKVVIATNIAETGITIPDITAVIDTGKEKVMRFDERRQISKLVEVFVARANAKQRRGRAGRVQEGICFHLFSKYRHDKLLSDQQMPEMLRLSLQDLILRVKICNLGDIEGTLSEALDPPSSKNIRRAIESLKTVKALTGTETLTSLGKQLAKLPLDVFLGKLILYGAFFKCVDAAVSIAAILSSKSPFLNDVNRKSQIEASRKAFERGNSDLLTVYNAYCAWKKHRAEKNEFSFCRKNHLSPQALLNIEDVKTQLLVSVVDTGLLKLNNEDQLALNRARYTGRKRQFFVAPEQLDINSNNDTIVNSVIAWSFYPRLLTRHGKGWRNVSNNQVVVLHSASVNKHTENPLKWLSYYHIMQSRNRNYNAHETSAVEELAIALCCGDVEFKMYAGVISLDGNRVRFRVRDWKTMLGLRVLSTRIREVIAQALKTPKKELSADHKQWLDLFLQVLEVKKKPDSSEYITM